LAGLASLYLPANVYHNQISAAFGADIFKTKILSSFFERKLKNNLRKPSVINLSLEKRLLIFFAIHGVL